MNSDAMFALLDEARRLCGHREYVVIGSVSVLGMSEFCDVPPDMSMSIDLDCYTSADPPRIFDLSTQLGEGSPWHVQHQTFLDPVSPALPTLPDGWQDRLLPLKRGEITAFCLEPNDAAISKLARGEPRDLRWVRAGLRVGLVSHPSLLLRLRSTQFLDEAESRDARLRIDALITTATS